MRARRIVEENRIPFFDFFRNSAFGFIQTSDDKGFFALLMQHENGTLESICSCSAPKDNDACVHGLALYLRLTNWPHERQNLGKIFEDFPIRNFLQNMASKFKASDLLTSENPKLLLPEATLAERLEDYLGFGSDFSTSVNRDRKCLGTAKNRTRSENERVMLQRQMPSARLAFEESPLYNLAKLMFYLDRIAPFKHHVFLLPDHKVRVVFSQGTLEVFTWETSIAQFLKATKNQWRYWESVLDFDVRRQGVPLHYRISFAPGNALEIEGVILLKQDHYVSPKELAVPGPGNLCYHPDLGYFHIQTGLSPFEMQYSDGGPHHVAPDDVRRFLKTHEETLEQLDRDLMDPGLFKQLVTPHFQSFDLTLLDFSEGLFSVALQTQLGGLSFDFQGLRELFGQPTRYAKAGGKLFDTLGYDAVYLKPFLDSNDNPPKMSVVHLFRFLSLFRERLNVHTNQLTEAVYASLKNAALPEAPSLTHTKLKLRPYQQLGFQWLHFLHSFSLGGLLCDQMGLGKTHQSMALIAATFAQNPKGRVLVVAPTSVLFHWRQKLKSFCPDVRVHLHHGAQRAALSCISPGQVVLTSYGTARNDAKTIEEFSWDLIVFDEVHVLKNKSTKAYQAISRFQSKARIGLTGTPIENHLSELKSLFDLVLPNYLGSDALFRRYFLDPILKFKHQAAKDQLQNMISPFILRRAKAQVLTELPEKVEDLRDYELDGYERELYEKIKTQGKAELEEASQAGPPRVMHIFQIINKLKQACNHPGLYFGNPDYRAYPATKWDMFVELLQETMASGEKLVVFTQYLGMVDMIRAYLSHEAIEHACVTGSTKNREAQQGRFQQDPKCRVFVGTLQAAGVGIDLTAGSVLVHYDRWWNPAREEQATDRIHRIGQKNSVQVYKFRGLNTVEARINRIIEQKRSLLTDMVSFDSDQVGKSFTVDELLDILA